MASLAAYGANINAGVNVNADHGWGGWQWPVGVPDNLLGTAQYGKVKSVVRKELTGLFSLAYQIAKNVHNYTIVDYSPSGEYWGPFGYENRRIAGTDTASNHSKGKANDWNAPWNPYSMNNFTSDFPPEMVAHLESIGLCWGGRYGDTMHWEFGFYPADVTGFEDKARKILGGKIVAVGGLTKPDPTILTTVEDDDMPRRILTIFDGKMNPLAQALDGPTGVVVLATPAERDCVQAVIDGDTLANTTQIDVYNAVLARGAASWYPKVAPAALVKQPATHVVVKGDTLSGIAKAAGKSVADLAKWNNIANPADIAVGAILKLSP